MEEAFDPPPVFENLICDHLRAHDVGLKEHRIVADAAGDVGLGRQVRDRIHLFDQGSHGIGVTYVAVPEMEAVVVENGVRQVVAVAGIG